MQLLLRAGPVTSEPPTYPRNREVPRAAELDEAGASAVLTARLLANHWRTGECSIGERRSKLEGRNYSTGSCACSCDYEAQKEAIVSYCGEAFFPAELLHSRFVRVPRGAPRGLPGDSKRLRLKEMEQKENENKAADDKANASAKAAAEGECCCCFLPPASRCCFLPSRFWLLLGARPGTCSLQTEPEGPAASTWRWRGTLLQRVTRLPLAASYLAG